MHLLFVIDEDLAWLIFVLNFQTVTSINGHLEHKKMKNSILAMVYINTHLYVDDSKYLLFYIIIVNGIYFGWKARNYYTHK
jgi:hypothetical protein